MQQTLARRSSIWPKVAILDFIVKPTHLMKFWIKSTGTKAVEKQIHLGETTHIILNRPQKGQALFIIGDYAVYANTKYAAERKLNRIQNQNP